jgi:hypothetical protein
LNKSFSGAILKENKPKRACFSQSIFGKPNQKRQSKAMPALENPRREKFAQGIVKGLPQVKAYQEAGYSPQRQNASRMMTNDDIQQRLSELRELKIGEFATEKDFLRKMFMQNYSLAIASSNLAAANVAADKLARLDGHMVDRKEIGGPGDFANLSDAELIELIAEPLNGASGDYDASAPAGGFGEMEAPESE